MNLKRIFKLLKYLWENHHFNSKTKQKQKQVTKMIDSQKSFLKTMSSVHKFQKKPSAVYSN